MSSAFTAQEFEEKLNRICNIVIGLCASRFLSRSCNAFAESDRYSFVDLRPSSSATIGWVEAELDETQGDQCQSAVVIANTPRNSISLSSTSPSRAISGDICIPSPIISNDRVEQVTVVGISRFLDNFSCLYGNPLSTTTKQEQEQALLSVLQASSLQWLPVSSFPDMWNMNLFLDAWIKAHRLLVQSKSSASFRHVSSVLLFSMIGTPPQLKDRLRDDERLDILFCDALQMLHKLSNLVHKYCDTVSGTSHYRPLLKTAVSIMYWQGYVRDTVSALFDNRPCILPDAPGHDRGMSASVAPMGRFSSCLDFD